MIGSSGSTGERLRPLTASALSLPDLIRGTTEPPPNIATVSPDATEMAAGPPPL